MLGIAGASWTCERVQRILVHRTFASRMRHPGNCLDGLTRESRTEFRRGLTSKDRALLYNCACEG